MARRASDAEYWAKQDEQRRELEERFARMREAHRLEDEREAQRRERL